MFSNERIRRPVVPELAAAGILLILGAVGAVRLAVAPPSDVPMSPTAWSALLILVATLLAASGIESLRRRHFLFVFLAPAVPALVTLGYVVHSGQTGLLSQIVISVAIMALVRSQRAAFA